MSKQSILQRSIAFILMMSFLFYPISTASSVTNSQSFEVSFATYFGGSSIEEVSEVACSSDDSVVIVGHTSSQDLPTSKDAFQANYSGGEWDIFVTKFDINGELVFSSFLGGSDFEHVDDVKVRSDGSIIVVGFTLSLDFPVTSDALQSSSSGDTDGFITRISSDGTELMYSTYFGGSLRDTIRSIRLDQDENYLIAGSSASPDLATDGAFQLQPSGGQDSFIAKITQDGSSTIMFSYVGGEREDRVQCMTIDSFNNYILSGQTNSQDFPVTEEAFQEDNSGGWDAFLTKISSDGTSLIFSTYIGGSTEDVGRGAAVNSLDEIVLVGYTNSTDFKTQSPLQSGHAGGYYDIFIYKCNSGGLTEFATYLGGNQFDIAYAAAFDYNDRPIIIGRTLSDDFPTINSFQEQRGGHLDTTITMLTPDGQTVLFSSFIGGTAEDSGESIAIQSDETIVISGRTASTDFPCTENAYQTTIGGSYDVFLCRILINTHSQNLDSMLVLFVSVFVCSIIMGGFLLTKKWRRG